MPYVIVTALEQWAPIGTDERGGLLQLRRWAQRLDDLDGQPTTSPEDLSWGGRIRHIDIGSIGMQSDRLVSRHEAWTRAENAMTRAFWLAAQHARGGSVGLAYGHGHAAGREAWIDLAPMGILRVDHSFFQGYAAVKDGTDSSRGLDRKEQLFELLGSVWSNRPRPGRIELYSCGVGASRRGRSLLDWIHYYWRVPIRALVGDLEVSGNQRNPSVVPEVRVLPPRASRRGGEPRVWRDQLITDPRLWARSRRRRPDRGSAP
ncbi:MAG: hypothetical protein EVA89_32730 [Sandaracinaceae bacterium]|nr:MAG: hypothetical protein EVA89_32730 [Sandaracinaceae bacterium]